MRSRVAGPPAAASCTRRVADLLPTVPLCRRLRHARCARAEVLECVLPWCRARGPARPRLRPAGIGRAQRGHGDLRAAHPGAVAPFRLRARLLPGAGARSRRGAGVRAGRRPGDGRRARAAGRRATGQSARRAGQAEPDAGRPDSCARPGLGEHTDEVLAAAGYGAEEIAALHEAGAVAGPASSVQGSFLKTS